MDAKVFLIGYTGINVTMTNDKAPLDVAFVISHEKSILEYFEQSECSATTY